MDLGLRNKVILVAASSKGLGFGIAKVLAAEGAKLSLASRSPSGIRAAASQLQTEYGSESRSYVFDATDSHSIDQWVSSSRADFGRIDGLVVNAGGPPSGTFESFGDSEWQKAFELTLLSAVRMFRAVLPEMKQNGCGSILTITSSSIKEPIPGLILSNVFRAGVVSLVKTLATELAPHGIRINNIVPGRINTERVQALDKTWSEQLGESLERYKKEQQRSIPLGRYGTVDEFGAAGAFLLSDRSSYITGTTLVVDGGKMRTVW